MSIRAIAERVGCTPPAIYMHFSDKDELFFELCEARFAEFTEVLRTAFESSDDPLEALRASGRSYIRFALENPEHYRVLFMSGSLVPGDKPPEEVAGFQSFMLLVNAVQHAVEAGAIREVDPFVTAVALWVSCHGLASLLIGAKDFPWPDTEQTVEQLLDIQLFGLAPARPIVNRPPL